jgi:hypothetical protein
VDPLLTAVNSIHPVDEPPLASGIDWVFELVHVSLGLLLLDGIPRAFVWFSAGHVSRATVYVIWKVFRGFLFGFPAGHVSWGCLPVIWMVFRWLFYFVYLFIVVWISSRGFPYPTCISYLFRINLILLLSNGLCITTSGL